MPVTPDKVKDTEGISILHGLTVGPDMPPGDYLLQLLATDKKNSKKRDEEGVAPKEPGSGFLSKMLRSFTYGPINYDKKDKGVASQILSFTVTEE